MGDEAESVLRNARRAAALAFLCMTVVVLLVVIDGQRNKVLLKHIEDARSILNDFKIHAGGFYGRANGSGAVAVAAGLGGSADDGPVAGGDGRDDPDADAAAGAANASAGVPGEAGSGVPWPVRESPAGGPRRNGRGAGGPESAGPV